MTAYIKDDVRFMSHEQRVAEGFMAPAAAKTVRGIECCFCGKTVMKVDGVPVRHEGRAIECPRKCRRP